MRTTVYLESNAFPIPGDVNIHEQTIEIVEHTPKSIDEYIVIVNDVSDWDEIHNYIINENEIDGIPNRKIECVNLKEYSLRSSLYEMSAEEAEVLRAHPKVESVSLNPDKYSIARSKCTDRFRKDVAFNKPILPSILDGPSLGISTVRYTNDGRSNWSCHFVSGNQTSEPFQGVGIASTNFYNADLQYSLSGKGVDALIIDDGMGVVHPEFIAGDGTYRAKDLILDGPYTIDPDYFTTNNHTYTKIVDGVNLGVGIATVAARNWWTNSANRSAAFQSLGTISSIDSRYTVGHSQSKTTNSDSNQMTGGHGTACASQIGGKNFGLAFECNIWSIRINFGDAYVDSSTALDIATIFHNAKKISQSGDPNPTLINNSYGLFATTGNVLNTTYDHVYRGNNLTYTGSGTNEVYTIPANSGSCRNTTVCVYEVQGVPYGWYTVARGEFLYPDATTNSAAENAIAAGCIVVASAGNSNQKLADATDIDFDNSYTPSVYGVSGVKLNRVQGVQKGFSGSNDNRNLGSIRVGALDCAVEPSSAKQGATPYAIRKACYSNNGPMINVWSPAEMTMAAGYAGSYEEYQRQDDPNFYDKMFNGTSSAGPNACSVIALYLETNRKANQDDVREWLDTYGTVEIELSDPYPDVNSSAYWTDTVTAADIPDNEFECYNIGGNGNLRGAPKKVLNNPFANNTVPKLNGVTVSGISFKQS